jgi:chromosome segregation ATPase
MKQYLSVALALVCIGLVISLVVMKRGDDARHESDASSLTDYSNQLDSAQTQVAIYHGTILVLSNNLNETLSASLMFSNQLAEAKSTIALDTEQFANLNQHVAEANSENQTLNQRFMDLTNQTISQLTGLTNQIAVTRAGLEQANKDYALLENRLRRDVAERVVVERKFNNLSELQTQVQRLKDDPMLSAISAQSIYAGLDVEVKSNSFHVLAPN